jgi:hypothetical protein
VTPEERELLETTARSLLKLEEQVAGMQIILCELLLSKEAMALARLRIRSDLLKMKGTPSAYLDAFLKSNKQM